MQIDAGNHSFRQLNDDLTMIYHIYIRDFKVFALAKFFERFLALGRMLCKIVMIYSRIEKQIRLHNKIVENIGGQCTEVKVISMYRHLKNYMNNIYDIC